MVGSRPHRCGKFPTPLNFLGWAARSVRGQIGEVARSHQAIAIAMPARGSRSPGATKRPTGTAVGRNAAQSGAKSGNTRTCGTGLRTTKSARKEETQKQPSTTENRGVPGSSAGLLRNAKAKQSLPARARDASPSSMASVSCSATETLATRQKQRLSGSSETAGSSPMHKQVAGRRGRWVSHGCSERGCTSAWRCVTRPDADIGFPFPSFLAPIPVGASSDDRSSR